MAARKKPIKIGLIGIGKMGENHARVLSVLKTVSFEFVYDINTSRAKMISEKYGIRKSDNLSRDLRSVDAVLICTPTQTHLELLDFCSQRVKNIFVEKPMVASMEEDLLASKLIKQRNLHVQVGFIERFNPAVQRLKEMLGPKNSVIQLDFFRTNRLSSRIKDVDVVMDLMIHDIDLAIDLNGPIRDVTAFGRMNSGQIEFSNAVLVHKNKSISRLVASRVTEKKMRLIQATCSNMFIDCDLLRKEIHISRQSSIKKVKGNYSISSSDEMVEVPPQEALLSELLAFSQYSAGDSVSVPGPTENSEALRICSKIQNLIRGSQ